LSINNFEHLFYKKNKIPQNFVDFIVKIVFKAFPQFNPFELFPSEKFPSHKALSGLAVKFYN